MFTKFNKLHDFKGVVGGVPIYQQDIFLLVNNAVIEINSKFGVACDKPFVEDLTDYIDTLFDVYLMDFETVINDMNHSIRICRDLSQLCFDVSGEEGLASHINGKIENSSYVFSPSPLPTASQVEQYFSGEVYSMTITNGLVFECLRILTHNFESKFGVQVPEEFVKDFYTAFNSPDLWPDTLLKHFTDKLSNASTIKNLSFNGRGFGIKDVVSDINLKFKHNLYDFKYFDVYYQVDPLYRFRTNTSHYDVQEIFQFKGTADKAVGNIVYSSANLDECEKLVENLNDGVVTLGSIFNLTGPTQEI